MKNVIKITSLTIFTMLLIVGSSMAQEETLSSKPEKKCGGACCSSKESATKMDKNHMDHKIMMDVKSIDKNKDGKVYQCPMCSDQISDEKGKCEKCGMELKEVSVKETKGNLGQVKHKMMGHGKMDHSKMNHTSAAKNEKNDFTLIDKNKDGKVFQCPMICTEDIFDEAGECAVCGMKRKEVSIKDAKKNIADHQHKTK